MSGPLPWLLAGPSVAGRCRLFNRRTQGESQFVDLTCYLLKTIFNAHWNILVQGFRSLPRPPRCAYISSGVRQGGGGQNMPPSGARSAEYPSGARDICDMALYVPPCVPA